MHVLVMRFTRAIKKRYLFYLYYLFCCQSFLGVLYESLRPPVQLSILS